MLLLQSLFHARSFHRLYIEGKDIGLTMRKIFEILGVSCEGLLVDDMKIWPNIPGFSFWTHDAIIYMLLDLYKQRMICHTCSDYWTFLPLYG